MGVPLGYGRAQLATFKAVIPNLPRLHAVVFGKAVRSERPVVVEIPYVAAKASPKQELTGTATQTADAGQSAAAKE